MLPKWQYKGKDVSDDNPLKNIYGFIYEITYNNGQKYIGKKQIWNIIKVNKGKKELSLITDKRVSNKKTVIRESKWRDYTGSVEIEKDMYIVHRRIISLVKSKIDLTYYELHHQIINRVIVSTEYINKNIAGKFYRGRVGTEYN